MLFKPSEIVSVNKSLNSSVNKLLANIKLLIIAFRHSSRIDTGLQVVIEFAVKATRMLSPFNRASDMEVISCALSNCRKPNCATK